MGATKAILLALLFTGWVRAEEAATEDANESPEVFQKKLEAMLNVLCNIETKKYMMMQAESVQKYLEKPEWSNFLQKVVGRSMKSCLMDLANQELFMKIATASTEEDRKKIHFPYFDQLKLDELWEEESKGPDEEEKQLHQLFLSIDETMKTMDKDGKGPEKPTESTPKDREGEPEPRVSVRDFTEADEAEL
jgi:hypothetical protein